MTMWLSTILLFLVLFLILTSFSKRGGGGRLPDGPRGLPLFGSLFALLNDPFEKMREFAVRYGPVYTLKVGPVQTVVLSDVRSIQEAFSKRSQEFSGRPKVMADATGLGRRGLVLLSPGSYHRYQKKTTFSLLRELGVGTPRFDEMIQPHVQYLLSHFGDSPRVIDIKKISSNMMSDIIGGLTFGQSLYQDNTSTSKQVRKLISENFQTNPIMILAGKFLPKCVKHALSNFVDMETNIAKMLNLMKALVQVHDNKIDSVSGEGCFVAKYLQEFARTHDGMGLTEDEEAEKQLGAIIIDFFQAGCETTDIYLRWVLLLLAAHPEVQRKAQEEIDSVFGAEPPRLQEKAKLPYTTAILYESLRIRPPAPLGAPHCTTVDATFRGYTIPAGTVMMSNLLTAHFVERDFPEPYRFRPERFLDENHHLVSLKDVLAFGIGPRICVGEQLAKSISLVCVMNILHRYDLRSKDDNKVDISYKGGVNLFPKEDRIKVIPRQR